MNKAVFCEVCELPHRAAATECEACGHRLGSQPDWAELEQELPVLMRKIVGGATAFLLLAVLNLWLFQGAGTIVLLAPLGWALFGGLRYRLLKKRLRLRRSPR